MSNAREDTDDRTDRERTDRDTSNSLITTEVQTDATVNEGPAPTAVAARNFNV